MKKIIIAALGIFLFSCNNEKQEEKKEPESAIAPTPGTTATETAATETAATLPEFAYPVDRAHWKMGDPANTKLILDMYHAWDARNGGAVAGFFADSANLDMPDARRLTLNRDNVFDKLVKWRSRYGATSNKIILAMALRNDDYNEDWVMVMTYNKWSYKDGVKDSMLYFDNWRLKEGKINYLNSLEQKPPTALLKRIESK